MQVLLVSGADVNLQDAQGNTPYDLAANDKARELCTPLHSMVVASCADVWLQVQCEEFECNCCLETRSGAHWSCSLGLGVFGGCRTRLCFECFSSPKESSQIPSCLSCHPGDCCGTSCFGPRRVQKLLLASGKMKMSVEEQVRASFPSLSCLA